MPSLIAHRTNLVLTRDCIPARQPSPRTEGDKEILSATQAALAYINKEGYEWKPKVCLRLETKQIEWDSVRINELGGNAGGQKRVRFKMGVAASGLTARYDVQLARLTDYCLTSTDCWNAWKPGQYAWTVVQIEPLTTYAQFEKCMGTMEPGNNKKRYCICENLVGA